jgi:hypothetical protein
MAHSDPIPSAAPLAGIAEPHHSTVAAILRAVGRGLFTTAEAETLIDRLRVHLTAMPIASPITSPITSPLSVEDDYPSAGAHVSGIQSHPSE